MSTTKVCAPDARMAAEVLEREAKRVDKIDRDHFGGGDRSGEWLRVQCDPGRKVLDTKRATAYASNPTGGGCHPIDLLGGRCGTAR